MIARKPHETHCRAYGKLGITAVIRLCYDVNKTSVRLGSSNFEHLAEAVLHALIICDQVRSLKDFEVNPFYSLAEAP